MDWGFVKVRDYSGFEYQTACFAMICHHCGMKSIVLKRDFEGKPVWNHDYPTGTGKTHIAMAYGYECCQHKLKTYFVKMSELNDMFT